MTTTTERKVMISLTDLNKLIADYESADTQYMTLEDRGLLDRLKQNRDNIPEYCDICREGEGWICEQHPNMFWPHDECTGPGMPCENGCLWDKQGKMKNPPRKEEGVVG